MLDSYVKGYTANTSDALVDIAKHEYVKNPTAIVQDLLDKWGTTHPSMTEITEGNEVSQLDRIKDEVFAGVTNEHLSIPELESLIEMNKASAMADTFTTRALNGESGARSAIDAIDLAESVRPWWNPIVSNPSRLGSKLIADIGGGKAYTAATNALSYGEKALLDLPTIAHKQAINSSIDELISAAKVRLVNEINYLNKSLTEMSGESRGKRGVDALCIPRK